MLVIPAAYLLMRDYGFYRVEPLTERKEIVAAALTMGMLYLEGLPMNYDSESHATGTAHGCAPWYRTPPGVAGAMAVMILGFYLLREHWHHIAGYWSYILLLACPLMHLFHGGHHGRGGHPHTGNKSGHQQR